MLYMLEALSGSAQSKCLGLEPKWHCHFGIPRQHRRLYHVSTLMVGRLWGFVGVDNLKPSTRMMGITQVGSGETEGFDEGTDLVYHDASEDPNVLETGDTKREAVLSHGGCGSSSLRECIELLNNPVHKSSAPWHSGANMENRSGPPHPTGFGIDVTAERARAV